MASGAKAGRDRGGGQRGGRWSLGAENSSPGSTANKNLNLNSANNGELGMGFQAPRKNIDWLTSLL